MLAVTRSVCKTLWTLAAGESGVQMSRITANDLLEKWMEAMSQFSKEHSLGGIKKHSIITLQTAHPKWESLMPKT